MQRRRSGVLLGTIFLAASALAAGAADLSNLRGKRYGEVLLGKGGFFVPSQFDVYNTIGLNECPQALWSKLDVERIKRETGVKAVKLNGPRYWVIDGIAGSSLQSKEQRHFCGLAMRHAGTLKLSLKDKISLGKPYVVHRVDRHTTWVFKAQRPVYQLLGPDGSVYFMQSFSIESEKQTADSLKSLANRLKLPKGWTFRTFDLKRDFNLTAEKGIAYVVQDDLHNTYQKSTAKATDDL